MLTSRIGERNRGILKLLATNNDEKGFLTKYYEFGITYTG